MRNAQWFRARARDLYHVEGEVEIDQNARVSLGGAEGAYVQAWVWVPSAQTKRRTVPGREAVDRSARVTSPRRPA